MSAEQPLRVGIVGYGLAGRVFHGALLAADPAWRVENHKLLIHKRLVFPTQNLS